MFLNSLVVQTSKHKAIPNEQVTAPTNSKGNPRIISQSTQLIKNFFSKNGSSAEIGGAKKKKSNEIKNDQHNREYIDRLGVLDDRNKTMRNDSDSNSKDI